MRGSAAFSRDDQWDWVSGSAESRGTGRPREKASWGGKRVD